VKTYFDCIPCLLRQTLEAGRLVSDDESLHERLMREILAAAAQMDLRRPPPVMAQYIHRRIRELSGNDDPYRAIKQRFNRTAWDLLPALKERIDTADDPLPMAVRAAIAGNVIDLGAKTGLEESHVREAMEQCLEAPLAGDVPAFARAIEQVDEVLYLADNAGEVVFDRLLIEQLLPRRVTVVVKGGPIINDAVMADAREARLDEMAELIDNGSDAPGTMLDQCSDDFRRRFDEAPLVIAKGQANYETLNDARRPIFFLLQVKCPLIAKNIGQPLGRLLLTQN
jgi:hypothetical protein